MKTNVEVGSKHEHRYNIASAAKLTPLESRLIAGFQCLSAVLEPGRGTESRETFIGLPDEQKQV